MSDPDRNDPHPRIAPTVLEPSPLAGDPACLFCRIVAGIEPAFEVWRDDDTVAFLDVRPVFKGHVLVVPVVHVETLPECTAVGDLFERVRSVAAAVEQALGAHGSFVAVNNRISQSVPHLHVHVVPRHRKDGLRGFFWPRTRYENDDEAALYAERLHRCLVVEPDATDGGTNRREDPST